LFWHLGRKAAGVDAEINERVHDDSADERGGEDHQHFQAEATHTGILSAAWLAMKSGDSKKTRPRRSSEAAQAQFRMAGPTRNGFRTAHVAP
jgi:hypothetical protein